MTSTSDTHEEIDSSYSPRERLLRAAAKVIARDGLAASTTREIAKVAGVNESTLYRHFTTKQNLLEAVLQQLFAAPAEHGPGASPQPEDESVGHLIRQYAEQSWARVQKNFELLRVFVGEMQHLQGHELEIMRSIFRPERERLVERLRAAQEKGRIRPAVNPYIVTDQVGAIVFMGLLRSSVPSKLEYTPQEYLGACIENIVCGIETSSGPAAQ